MSGSILQVKLLNLTEKVFQHVLYFGNNSVLVHILIVVVDFFLCWGKVVHLIEILQRHICGSTWGVRSGSCSRPDIDCNRCQLNNQVWLGVKHLVSRIHTKVLSGWSSFRETKCWTFYIYICQKIGTKSLIPNKLLKETTFSDQWSCSFLIFILPDIALASPAPLKVTQSCFSKNDGTKDNQWEI